MFGRERNKPVIRWQREADAFAVRLDLEDLQGLLQRGVIVEPGTQALIVQNGQTVGLVPPGRYTLDTLKERISDWMRGLPHHATALLVDVTPTDLVFHLGGRFTKDPLPIGLTLRLFVSVDDAARFLINVLKGQSRLSIEELRQFLYPEVVQVADRWLRQRTLEELMNDPKALQVLELELEEALKGTFRDTGLKFHRVRAVELNLEPYERLTGKKGEYVLLVQEEEIEGEGEAAVERARLKRRRTMAELQKEIDLVELAEETRKVERQERLVELYERMRRAVLSDKMNEVRSEADFERFLDEIDREKLLREKERQDLLRTWKEEAEDHELARRFLLDKLQAEQRFELERLRLERQFGLDEAKLKAEIALARQRTDWELEQRRKLRQAEIENERERLRIEEEKKRKQLELEQLQRRMERAEEREDAMLGLELLSKMKEIKRLDEEERRRIAREDEIARQKAALEMEIRRWEMRLREKEMEQQHELARMEYMAQMGTEALITLSGAEQARLLADLKKTEALKGMSEEQILALAAKDSPEVARAFQERFRAVADGQASAREREMYERLLSEKDAREREVAEAWRRSQQESVQAIKDLAEKSVDAMRDIGVEQAQNRGGQPPIIVTGTGGATGNAGGATGSAAAGAVPKGKKICPKCGRFVDEDWRFCGYCGYAFES